LWFPIGASIHKLWKKEKGNKRAFTLGLAVGFSVMYDGYVLFCGKSSVQECLSKKRYTCADKKTPKVMEEIKPNSIVFLFNIEDKSLLGPFTALPEGDDLDAGAWAMDIDDNIEPYSDVNVTWEELHLLQNAPEQLPFLKDLTTCKLTTTQVQRALDLLKKGELYLHNKERQEGI